MAELDHRMFMKDFLAAEAVLKGYLLSACGDLNAADELLGEVSSVLWEKFDKYDPERPFQAWALGVARLELLKWRQSLARGREVLSPEAIDALADTAGQCSVEIDERLAHLRNCLQSVGASTRRVLRLRYWRRLKVGQIARQVGKSTAAIEMTLVRARRGLRDCVEGKLARATGGGS
ncbi:MAG: sigma-70 family RNA polymerase sigma factor [Phycisphaerae bacterium]|jgi:RNA polymerase sigma-70 factor (ECF subfamily)|nr:sigma-70 family RNA polymerase sigma factor [Phycisphaerae bacterium]